MGGAFFEQLGQQLTSFDKCSGAQIGSLQTQQIEDVIQMATEARKLETNALALNGRKAKPQEAAFLSQSLRGHLGIKTGGAQ